MDNNYYCALDHWNFVRQQALIRAGPARRRSSVQVTSYKLQATSYKQQATSNKQQATSNKQQATSNKHLGGSRPHALLDSWFKAHGPLASLT
jgi:hypothetical protein